MQRVGHQGAPVGPVPDLATHGSHTTSLQGGRSRESCGSCAPSVVTSPRPSPLSPPGVSAAVATVCSSGSAEERREPRATGRRGRSLVPARTWRQLFSPAAVGGSRGDRDRCGSPSQGRSGKAGSGVCSQAGNHPRPPPKQIPPRGRAGAGSAGGSGRRQSDFTRPPGLGFPGRIHEL